MKTRTRFVLAGAAVAMGLLLSGCGFQSLEPANLAVKFDAASGKREVINHPGVIWVNPFTQRVHRYPTRITSAIFVRNSTEGDRSGDDSIQASTLEGTLLPMDIAVSYHIDPGRINEVFENFGEAELSKGFDSIQNIHVRQATEAAVNLVTGKHSIFDIISKDRSKLGPEVREKLQQIFDGSGLMVDDVLVREVYPPEQITERINEQLALKTDLEKAKPDLQRAKVEAQTAITNAQAEAARKQLLASQGDKSIDLKKIELQKLLIERWNGVPSLDGGIPFVDGSR